MSLEELKRVTEAHNSISHRYLCSFSALKSQLNDVREKHQGESETKENLIAELRKKIQDMEEEAARKPDLSKETENLEKQVVSKQKELEEALEHESALKIEIEKLRQQLKDTEAQVSKVKGFPKSANCVECGRYVIARGAPASERITRCLLGCPSNIS